MRQIVALTIVLMSALAGCSQSKTANEADQRESIRITMAQDGYVTFDGRLMSVGSFMEEVWLQYRDDPDFVADVVLDVRADKETPYHDVMRVVEEAQNISMAGVRLRVGEQVLAFGLPPQQGSFDPPLTTHYYLTASDLYEDSDGSITFIRVYHGKIFGTFRSMSEIQQALPQLDQWLGEDHQIEVSADYSVHIGHVMNVCQAVRMGTTEDGQRRARRVFPLPIRGRVSLEIDDIEDVTPIDVKNELREKFEALP